MASVATRIISTIGSAFGSAVLATIVSTVLENKTNTLTSAYHYGFATSLIFMVIAIAPALFLTNRLKKNKTAPPAVQTEQAT